jgi:YHS domain-containing protein
MKPKFFFAAFLLSVISITSFAQDAASLRKKQFNLDDEVGIEGYDPVAYFKLGKAVKGKKDITTYYQGVTYRFSTPEFREEFKKNPSGYEPQYGGWCAYAMGAKAEKVSIDPKTFKIVNGKLYLFYHSYWNNTLTDWNKDESNLKTKADAAWQKIFR